MEIYWTQKNGKKILVDDMTENHAKNMLKMLLRNMEISKQKTQKEFTELTGFKLNGDMANEFNDQQEMDADPFYEDTDYPY